MAVPNSFTNPDAGRIVGPGDSAKHKHGFACRNNHAVILDHAYLHRVVHRVVDDERIERRLAIQTLASAAIGSCIGGMLGAAIAYFLVGSDIASPLVVAGIGAVVGGLLGVLLGLDAPQPHGERRAGPRQSGLSVALIVNPVEEDRYWREAYRREPYFQRGRAYEDYAQAYKLGYLGRACMTGSYAAAEPALEAEWNDVKGDSYLTWHEASPASRAAWNRASHGPIWDRDAAR